MEQFEWIAGPRKAERGSFMVAGAFFLVGFLMVAGMGVDLSRYYMTTSKMQSIADGAALAGAQAMNQPEEVPNRNNAFRAAVEYVRNTQGDTFADQYGSNLSDGDNIQMSEPLVDAEGDTFYRFGVVVYGQFEPYFLPRDIFGDDVSLLSTTAVARVEGSRQQQIRDRPLDCGLIVGRSDTAIGINITGNNWSMEGGSMCSNADIDFEKGKDDDFPISQYKGASCTDKNSSCPNLTKLDEVKQPPSFEIDNPSAYDVDLSNMTSWDEGDCSSGNYEMETSDGEEVRWGAGGSAVCVTQTGSGYEFPNETGAQMTVFDGGVTESVSIWADDTVNFSENNSGIDGGLYSTGDVIIDKNSHNFIGDENEVGGLSVYAEGSIEVSKNNSVFQGVIGADEDLKFTSNGGGKNKMIGQVMVGDEFLDASNSNSVTDVTYDTSVFNPDAVNPGGWEVTIQSRVSRPYFSTVNVSLIN